MIRRLVGPARRRWPAATSAAAGAVLLGVSMTAPPGSPRFYRETFGVAATWIAGARAAGPIPLAAGPVRPRDVTAPVAVGAGAFAAFYGAALLARHIPILNRAIAGILGYAHQGRFPLVLATTLANGVAEELMFRGAVYDACDGHHPVVSSTAAYALATTATRNPALVLAAVVLGTLFAAQRRVTGGVLAPTLTHATWATLMLRYLPPLFPPQSG
jgi:hypothetical protein